MYEKTLKDRQLLTGLVYGNRQNNWNIIFIQCKEFLAASLENGKTNIKMPPITYTTASAQEAVSLTMSPSGWPSGSKIKWLECLREDFK